MTSVMADGRARKTGFPGWSTKDGSPAGRLAQPTALTMARWKSSGWHFLRRFPSEVIHKVITSQRYNFITSWLYKVPPSARSIRFTGAAPGKARYARRSARIFARFRRKKAKSLVFPPQKCYAVYILPFYSGRKKRENKGSTAFRGAAAVTG